LLILILSPSTAPKLNGDEGSTQTIPTFLLSLTKASITASTKVLLPAPGGPVMPITGVDVWGSCCKNQISFIFISINDMLRAIDFSFL